MKKDYVVIVNDSSLGIYDDEIIIKNVDSLYADGFISNKYYYYTNIVINKDIVIHLPCAFIEYYEIDKEGNKIEEGL